MHATPVDLPPSTQLLRAQESWLLFHLTALSYLNNKFLLNIPNGVVMESSCFGLACFPRFNRQEIRWSTWFCYNAHTERRGEGWVHFGMNFTENHTTANLPWSYPMTTVKKALVKKYIQLIDPLFSYASFTEQLFLSWQQLQQSNRCSFWQKALQWFAWLLGNFLLMQSKGMATVLVTSRALFPFLGG